MPIFYFFVILGFINSRTLAARGNIVTAVYDVSRASKDNEGSYLCTAENEAGTAEDMLQIIIIDDQEGMEKFIHFFCS